jgi:cyclic nucleotide-binding protein
MMLKHTLLGALSFIFVLSTQTAIHAEELTGRQIMDESSERHDLPREFEELAMKLSENGSIFEERELRRFVGIFDLITQRIPTTTLNRFDLFNGMPQRHVRDLILTSVQRYAAPGETIIQSGKTDKSMLLLLEGKAGVFIQTNDGETKRISEMVEGDTVGEMSLLANMPRSANVVAETKCWLIEIDRNVLNRLQLTQPYLSSRVYQNIGTIISARLLAANERKK